MATRRLFVNFFVGMNMNISGTDSVLKTALATLIRVRVTDLKRATTIIVDGTKCDLFHSIVMNEHVILSKKIVETMKK